MEVNTDILIKRLWMHHFAWPTDTAPRYGIEELREGKRLFAIGFSKPSAFEVYDFLEAISAELTGKPKNTFVPFINSLAPETGAVSIPVSG